MILPTRKFVPAPTARLIFSLGQRPGNHVRYNHQSGALEERFILRVRAIPQDRLTRSEHGQVCPREPGISRPNTVRTRRSTLREEEARRASADGSFRVNRK
jgi:hypothetical protein